MPSSQIERKLAAIMFTDIAGYTKSMSKSESKTLNLLEKKRSILKPLLKEYKGTFVKEIGDGTLSYFESAVNAATCAVKLQETTYDDKEMNIRVGIHIGDIVFKDGDVFGGGVNVASRLESIAPAGGVCVSKSVFDELSNKDDFDGIELGLQSLKGVGRLIEVFGLKGEKLNEPDPQKYQENKIAVHTDDEVPSIAIIPFDNKGADEDVFFAYGISADLISDCSGAGLIRVAGLKDIEGFDYKKLQYDELASKFFVRYVSHGSLWKMGEMFQLSVELYDTKEKKVVWSDRWEEKWDNLTSIKGSLSDGLLKSLDIKPKVEQKVETTNPEAYEYYLRAKYILEMRSNNQDIPIARELIEKAIGFDDNMILAKSLLGKTYLFTKDNDKAMIIFEQNLSQAKELKDNSGIALSYSNIGLVFWNRKKYDQALDYFNRSLNIVEALNDKAKIAHLFHLIGHAYIDKKEFNNARKFWEKGKILYEEIEDEDGISSSKTHFGLLSFNICNYIAALEYFYDSLKIETKLKRKDGINAALENIGDTYNCIGEYDKALDSLSRALSYYKEYEIPVVESSIFDNNLEDLYVLNYNIGQSYYHKSNYKKSIKHLQDAMKLEVQSLCAKTYLFLSYKQIGKEYDREEIFKLIKKEKNIEYDINYHLFQLLEDKNYLKTAYSEIQEKADNLEPDVAAKFLSYPIPSAIVEEWEKVK